MQLPEIYTDHFDLQGAHYDPEAGDIVITMETRIPAPEAIGVPVAELVDGLAAADDDGQINKGEMLDGAMKALSVGAAFFSKKS